MARTRSTSFFDVEGLLLKEFEIEEVMDKLVRLDLPQLRISQEVPRCVPVSLPFERFLAEPDHEIGPLIQLLQSSLEKES